MNKKNWKNIFEESWNNFAIKISKKIEFQYKLAENDFNNKYKQIQKEIEDLESRNISNQPYHQRKSSFPNPYNEPEEICYYWIEYTREEIQEYLIERTNRQYQWFLVEAYEYFEDYIEELYACTGYTYNASWKAEDYGNKYISEISNLTLKEFCYLSRNRKGETRKIISSFRLLINNLEKKERNNSTKTDLFLWVTMIEMYRHIITHKSGIIDNLKDFVFKTMDKVGLGINNKKEPWNQLFIESSEVNRDVLDKIERELKNYHIENVNDYDRKLAFITIIRYLAINNNTIYIDLFPRPDSKFPEIMNHRLPLLVNTLLSYGYLLKTEVLSYLDSKQDYFIK